jgi:outer membrane protein insertion porin family
LPLKKEEKISICDKYFLGGPLNLRGFSNRGAGENVEDCSLGNDAYWLLAAHLYTPLPFLHNHKTLCSWFKTHSFVNVGNLLSIDQLGFILYYIKLILKNSKMI